MTEHQLFALIGNTHKTVIWRWSCVQFKNDQQNHLSHLQLGTNKIVINFLLKFSIVSVMGKMWGNVLNVTSWKLSVIEEEIKSKMKLESCSIESNQMEIKDRQFSLSNNRAYYLICGHSADFWSTWGVVKRGLWATFPIYLYLGNSCSSCSSNCAQVNAIR